VGIVIAVIAMLVILSRWATCWLPISDSGKALLRIAIVAMAFPLAIADEVIGKYQFESLCKRHGIDAADFSKARGRRVRVEHENRRPVPGTLLPMIQVKTVYLDAESGEVLAEYLNFGSWGGWLMRYLPLRMGTEKPMFFIGECSADSATLGAIFLKNRMTYVK
jgi:hypothetical protein